MYGIVNRNEVAGVDREKEFFCPAAAVASGRQGKANTLSGISLSRSAQSLSGDRLPIFNYAGALRNALFLRSRMILVWHVLRIRAGTLTDGKKDNEDVIVSNRSNNDFFRGRRVRIQSEHKRITTATRAVICGEKDFALTSGSTGGMELSKVGRG